MTLERKSPGTAARANSTTPLVEASLTAHLGLQRHEPLTAEDRADIDVIVAAAERGFRLAVRCTACGHWISNPTSVRRHLGPRCAARMAAGE